MDQSTIIRFRNPEGIEYILYLRDISGKLVRTIPEIRTDEIEILRNGLRPGYYSVELRGSQTWRGKLIIK